MIKEGETILDSPFLLLVKFVYKKIVWKYYKYKRKSIRKTPENKGKLAGLRCKRLQYCAIFTNNPRFS